MNQLPIEIAEHILSFLPGVQPPNKLFYQANSIPELIKQRVECVKKRYQTCEKACEANDSQAVYLFVKHTIIGMSRLKCIAHYSAVRGMYHVCEYLLKTPHYISADDVAYAAAIGLYGDIIHMAIDYGAYQYEYFLAQVVEKGDLKLFQSILKRCPRRFDYTCMAYHAGASGNEKMVNYIISKCPSINKYTIFDGARDNCKVNLAHYLKTKYELNDEYEDWSNF